MQEDEFLAGIEADPVNMGLLVPAIQAQYEVRKNKAESWTDLLTENLLSRKQYGEAVDAIGAFASCAGIEGRKVAEDKFKKLFKDEPDMFCMIQHAGFGNKRLLLGKCLGRMRMMLGLKPGAMVFDRKSWGFGVVKDVRYQEEKIEIDFEKKAGHQLAFSYAAEILQLLDENHLLARKHIDPEGLTALIKDDPGEVVIIALRSFGPMPVPILQDRLVPVVIEEGQWKKFWEGARRRLKNNPLIEFPAKRSEPILLLEKEKAYDDEWFAGFARNTDMESILAEVADMMDKGDLAALTGGHKDILKDRIGFTVNGSEGSRHNLLVRGLLAADQLGFSHEDVRAEKFIASVVDRKKFLSVLPELQARETKGLLSYLIRKNPEDALDLMIDVINELDVTTLGDAIERLLENGREEQVSASLRKAWSTWTSSMPMYYWFGTHLERLEGWNIGTVSELPARMLKSFVEDASGDVLKAQNQLKGLFDQKKWLQKVMDLMDVRQRGNLTQALKDSSAWETLDQRSILGQIVKLYPDMQGIVSGHADASEVKEVMQRVSSIRSMGRLQRSFEKLVREEIPRNSEDIKIAREHGDLRENAEFKAAKEHQSVLMARQADYDDMLKQIRPTDFADFKTDRAGIATTVTLTYDDGSTDRYHILGELDSDEGMGIISCSTVMAKVLQGKTAGERVTVPTATGETEATLSEVTPIPDVIRVWAADEIAG